VGGGERLRNYPKLTFDTSFVKIYSGFGENGFLRPEDSEISDFGLIKGNNFVS
jgi:hypothetical protein